MSTESILIEELTEKKTSLVLQPLTSFHSSDKTDDGRMFIKQHGSRGIYIAFIRKVDHEHTASLPDNITAQTLFKNLFEKEYINRNLYTGSGNILDRCGAMRAISMNCDPHGAAKYRNANPDVELDEIDVLFISMGNMEKGDITALEKRIHKINIDRTGKKGFAHDYSSSNGENGTKMSQWKNFISNASQDEWDTAMVLMEKKGMMLNIERLHNGL